MNAEQAEAIEAAIVRLAAAIKALADHGGDFDGKRKAVELACLAVSDVGALELRGEP